MLFAEPLIYNDFYGIEESKKGYLDLFVLDENSDYVYLLDNGRYLNSRIFIKDGDKRFFLRERGEYVIKTTDNTYQIKWRTDSLEVIENYYLVKDGFRYVITIKNRTKVARNVGLYIMYDTVLGEESKNHFLIDNHKIINREKIYRNTEIPQSIKSENERRQGLDFRFMESEIVPDSIILGNWDRLAYSKKWPYIPKEGGLFSYGYYSINDSGIGVVFNGVNLNSKDEIVYNYSILTYTTRDVEVTETVVTEKKKKWFFDSSPKEEETKITEDSNVTVEEPTEPEVIEESEKTVVTETPVEKEVPVVTEKPDDTDKNVPVAVDSWLPEVVKEVIEDEEPTSEDLEKSAVTDGETVTEKPVVTEKKSVTDDKMETSATSDDDIEPSVDKDELLLMLEYIQKKKRGEDVSGYDFTEEDILKRLNNNNE